MRRNSEELGHHYRIHCSETTAVLDWLHSLTLYQATQLPLQREAYYQEWRTFEKALNLPFWLPKVSACDFAASLSATGTGITGNFLGYGQAPYYEDRQLGPQWAGFAREGGEFGRDVAIEAGSLWAGARLACFSGDTMVHTPGASLRRIDSMKVGDLVSSINSDTGEEDCGVVSAVLQHRVEHAIIICLACGEKIVTTAEHPFLTAARVFVPAGDLTAGCQIATVHGGIVTVVAVEERLVDIDVYNLRIDPFHTYAVGERGAWVHNVKIMRMMSPSEATKTQIAGWQPSSAFKAGLSTRAFEGSSEELRYMVKGLGETAPSKYQYLAVSRSSKPSLGLVGDAIRDDIDRDKAWRVFVADLRQLSAFGPVRLPPFVMPRDWWYVPFTKGTF